MEYTKTIHKVPGLAMGGKGGKVSVYCAWKGMKKDTEQFGQSNYYLDFDIEIN